MLRTLKFRGGYLEARKMNGGLFIQSLKTFEGAEESENILASFIMMGKIKMRDLSSPEKVDAFMKMALEYCVSSGSMASSL